MELDNIVQISISRESTAIATSSFQIPLILSTHTKFAERARVYTDIDGIGDDFASTDKAYFIAAQIFGQDGATIPSVIIGRRQVDSVTITPTVANTQTYTITINDVAYTYTSDASATAPEISAGLVAAIGSLTGFTITDNTGSLTVAVTTPGTAWSILVSSNLTQVNETPTEDWVEALEAVEEANNSWYALVAETHVEDDVKALAAAIQARRKIYGTSTQDATVPTSATTDIASYLSNNNYSRTFIVYLPTADTQYPEAVWIGSQLAYTPGSNDWDFKQGSGITVSNLTDTKRVFLRNKNTNMFTTVAGVDIFQDGNMADATPIDEIVLEDWLYARLQEGVFSRLINSLKVPYTNAGFAMIETEIRSVLTLAQNNGGLDSGWTVTVPDVLSVSATLRAQRTAGTFVFKARLAGSVRKVIIEGFLSV